jgi:hypothetical protein
LRVSVPMVKPRQSSRRCRLQTRSGKPSGR